LADNHIDTDNSLTFLIQDGVYGNRGFACAAVADNQLALSAAIGIIASMALIPVCRVL